MSFNVGDPGHTAEHNRLAVVPPGLVLDGVTDNAATINATLAASLDRIVDLPSGPIAVSEPIVHTGRRWLRGAGTSFNGSAVTTLVPTADFAGDALIISTVEQGFYWHAGIISDLAVKMHPTAQQDPADYTVDANGIHIHQMGENSLLRNVYVMNAKKAGVLLTGTHAVGTIEMCSAWSCGGYGIKFTQEPEIAGNGGTVRVYGFSGDGNRPGLVYVDGGHQLDLSGIKYETYISGDPGPIVVGGTSSGGGRAKLNITGSRFAGDGGVGSIVTIPSTAKPSIVLAACHGVGWANIIDDQGSDVQVAGGNPPALLVYGSDGNDRADFYVQNGRLPLNSDVPGRFRHQGASLGFYGATATTRPTGVAVTAEGIHAALVSLGLIIA